MLLQFRDYNGYDFNNTWKIYEDHTNPLLKVFLTKANVKEDALKNLTYNGQNQLDINKLISDKTLTNQKDATFADFTHSSSLLQSNASKNAGTYTNWLWSAQIGSNNGGTDFDPNNLGYDFAVGSVEIAKKALTAKDFAASIVYGKQDGKDWQIDKNGTLEGVVSGDNVGLNWNGQWSTGEEYVTNQNKRDTADAGIYKENMNVTGIGLTGTEAGNYTISSEAKGDLTVKQANLEVSLKDISRVYGDLINKNYSGELEYKNGTKLVNGDSGLTVSVTNDGAIKEGTLANVKKTQNVGDYTWKGTLSGVDNLNTNYNVTFTDSATSKVTPADLEISLKDISRVYGDLINKNYSGELEYKNGTKLVNEDSGLTVSVTNDGAIKEGTLANVKKTQGVGDYTWKGTLSGVDNLNTNYNVTFTDSATSKVTPANLEISLKDISRVYGNLESKDYSQVWEYKNGTKLVNGDSGLTITVTKDGAIKEGSLTDVKKTQNVGDYTWTGTLGGVDNLNTNYNVTFTDSATSKVTPADLEVSLKDISRVYGNLESKDYSKVWEYKNGTKLVNGDSGLIVTATKDGSIKDGTLTEVKKTQNVGDYTWTGTLGGVDNLNTNYNVTFTDSATSKVTPADLEVSLKDISRVYGNLESKDYSKVWEYKNGTKLVNGDSGLTVTATEDGAIKKGTLTDVKKTQNVGDYTWKGTLSGVDKLNTNYNVTFMDSATSKVTPANLEVSLKDISRVYGNLESKDYSKAWEYKNGTKLVNGDDGLTVTVTKDGAIKEGSLIDVKKTRNVGDYTWTGTLSGVDNLNTNYNVTFTGSAASKVTKAKLNLDLNDVKRTYGDTTITEGSYSLKNYQDELVNGDSGTISFDLDKGKVNDGGLVDNGTKTNEVKEGGYTWSINKADLTGDGLNLNNYDIAVSNGKSYITPREVSLKDLTASIVYGSTDGIHAGDLSFKDGGIIYGDDVTVSGNVAIRENSKYANNKDNRDTADVGNYDSSLKVDNTKLNGEKAGNYNLVGDANGTITVTPAQLHVHTDDQTITIGQKPNYTGNLYGLVNGDSEEALGKLIYGIDDARYEQTAGTYIGMIRTVNGTYGELPSSYHKNYEITYDWGNLIVKPVDAPQFDYLFYDTPWDKQRNFRERRAELHFVDGGIHVG